MADEIVPVGPRDSVRGSSDSRRATQFAGSNPDRASNTPIASADADRTEDGVPKFGGGGVRVRALRAFWPQEQPDNDQLAKEARDQGRAHIHQENVVREGEVAEIPNDHAMDLMEQGVVERVKDKRNG